MLNCNDILGFVWIIFSLILQKQRQTIDLHSQNIYKVCRASCCKGFGWYFIWFGLNWSYLALLQCARFGLDCVWPRKFGLVWLSWSYFAPWSAGIWLPALNGRWLPLIAKYWTRHTVVTPAWPMLTPLIQLSYLLCFSILPHHHQSDHVFSFSRYMHKSTTAWPMLTPLI